MYGTQTTARGNNILLSFENDVKMYGTQTLARETIITPAFENDVKMYGTQTHLNRRLLRGSLRMM